MAQTDFSLKMLRHIALGSNETIKQTLLSPTSLAVALAMVYAGAHGQTAKELEQELAKGVLII